MILDPVQPVECDQCHERGEFGMTSLVQRSWANRNLEKQMKRAGWLTDGDRHFCCEDCAIDYAANT
jgi:hypothetical protein